MKPRDNPCLRILHVMSLRHLLSSVILGNVTVVPLPTSPYSLVTGCILLCNPCRWVKFDPCGHKLYTGIANSATIHADEEDIGWVIVKRTWSHSIQLSDLGLIYVNHSLLAATSAMKEPSLGQLPHAKGSLSCKSDIMLWSRRSPSAKGTASVSICRCQWSQMPRHPGSTVST